LIEIGHFIGMERRIENRRFPCIFPAYILMVWEKEKPTRMGGLRVVELDKKVDLLLFFFDHSCCLRSIYHPQLAIDIFQVILHCVQADVQFLGDLLVGVSGFQ
jgi:hypothetical protein